MIVAFEVVSIVGAMSVFCSVIIYLFGFLVYTEACLLDIESMFAEVNRLSRRKKVVFSPHKKCIPSFRKNCELMMLEYCKEAARLHARLNVYYTSLQFESPFFSYLIPLFP